MNNTNVLVGFFQVANVGQDSVETPLTGNPPKDYRNLWELIRKKYPMTGPKGFIRTGSVIESRNVEGSNFVGYAKGAVLKNLFDALPGEETAVNIGTVTFNKEPCEVVLRYSRAKNVVGVNLKERATRVTIRFSDQIAAMRLVSETGLILKGILGESALDFNLTLREIAT